MADEDKKRGLGSAPEETREEVARKGGEARKQQEEMGEGMSYEEMGRMGGEESQERGTAHELTREERSKGSEHSRGGGRKGEEEEEE